MRNKMQRHIQVFSSLSVFVALLALVAAVAQDSALQLPDSPGTVAMQAVQASGQTPQTTTSSSRSSSPQPQSAAQKPVGTAAAEKPTVGGVAASSSAGAAIAPGKQRRVRILLIKVAAIAGAGIAIGTVAALSNASPSKPPGSR